MERLHIIRFKVHDMYVEANNLSFLICQWDVILVCPNGMF